MKETRELRAATNLYNPRLSLSDQPYVRDRIISKARALLAEMQAEREAHEAKYGIVRTDPVTKEPSAPRETPSIPAPGQWWSVDVSGSLRGTPVEILRVENGEVHYYAHAGFMYFNKEGTETVKDFLRHFKRMEAKPTFLERDHGVLVSLLIGMGYAAAFLSAGAAIVAIFVAIMNFIFVK